MTVHNNAKKGDIADIVIMPGDPKRVEFIAKNYLTDYKLVNDVRYALCYTGFYKGKRVSVMASGMGMPSMGIYAYELFKFYDVDTIIRLGSCQSRSKDINLRDIILVDEAYTDSNFSFSYALEEVNVSKANKEVNQKIIDTSTRLGIHVNHGLVWTSDHFYKEKDIENEYIKNAIGLEMETYALLYTANKLNKKAASILTVSDSLFSKEELTPEAREKTLEDAINLSLESLI